MCRIQSKYSYQCGTHRREKGLMNSYRKSKPSVGRFSFVLERLSTSLWYGRCTGGIEYLVQSRHIFQFEISGTLTIVPIFHTFVFSLELFMLVFISPSRLKVTSTFPSAYHANEWTIDVCSMNIYKQNM